MTARATLEPLLAGAPVALRQRVWAWVDRSPARNSGGEAVPLSEQLLDGAERALRAALATPEARESAFDLLVADALATLAFEVAADEPGALGRRALDAMQRLARYGRPDD